MKRVIVLLLIFMPCSLYPACNPFYDVLFISTNKKQITNTTDETTWFNGGIGSLTFTPNFLKQSSLIKISARGTVSTGSSQEATLTVYIGTYTIVQSVGTLPNGMSGNYFDWEFFINVRGSR